MNFDQVARLPLHPTVGPPGPRVIAVLAVLLVAGLSSLGRGVTRLFNQVTPPRLQPIPVEVPRRRRL